MDQFKIIIGDTERVFKPAPITLRTEALITRYIAEMGKEEPTFPELMQFIASDEGRINEFVQRVYEGDHDGINWFDVDREYVYSFLAFFLMRMGNIDTGKALEQLKSSGSTDTSSLKKKPKAGTRSPTKRKRGA